MGQSHSATKLVSDVSASINLSNEISNTVGNSVNCMQNVELGPGCDARGAVFNLTSTCIVDAKEKISNISKNISDDDITSRASAIAKAINTNLSLTMGSSAKVDSEDAINFAKMVKNQTINTLNTAAENSIKFKCNSEFAGGVVNANVFTSINRDLTLNNETVIDSIDKIVQSNEGKSISETKDVISSILLSLAACILAVFLAPELGVAALGAAAPPQFTLALVVGICVGFATLFVWSQYHFRRNFWFPGLFEFIFPKEMSNEAAAKKYQKIMRVFYIIFALLGLYIVYVFLTINKMSGYSRAARGPQEVEMAVRKTKQAWGKFRKSHFGL